MGEGRGETRERGRKRRRDRNNESPKLSVATTAIPSPPAISVKDLSIDVREEVGGEGGRRNEVKRGRKAVLRMMVVGSPVCTHSSATSIATSAGTHERLERIQTREVEEQPRTNGMTPSYDPQRFTHLPLSSSIRPQGQTTDGQTRREENGRCEVVADGDERVDGGHDVEEERLVKPLEQVIERSEC